jgi:hypothetical protein
MLINACVEAAGFRRNSSNARRYRKVGAHFVFVPLRVHPGSFAALAELSDHQADGRPA